MAFKEQDRTGTVLGNKVTASPVSLAEVREVEAARDTGGETAVTQAMMRVVAAHVRDDEDRPIDANALSPRALIELYRFLLNLEGDLADFTTH